VDDSLNNPHSKTPNDPIAHGLKILNFKRALPAPVLLTQLIPHPLKHFGIIPTPNVQKEMIEESVLVRPPNLTLNSTSTQQILHTPPTLPPRSPQERKQVNNRTLK
jgi:hypothetical protein